MSTHTPGPWTLNGFPKDKMLIEAGADDRTLAVVPRHTTPDREPNADALEQADNARLITAAPDLLKAARDARAHNIVDIRDSAGRLLYPVFIGIKRETLDALTAAIAKAEA